MILVQSNVRETGEKINMEHLIQKDILLESYTSIKAGGRAEYIAQPENYEELSGLLAWALDQQQDVNILGSGTNTLISEKGVEGLLIDIKKLRKVHTRGTLLTAYAGSSMESVVKAAGDAGLSGLEYFSGLPGTVGGAVYGNAGCFGHEVADLIEWIEYMTPDGEMHKMRKDQYLFTYRGSPCKCNGWIITEVGFNLTPKPSIEIQDKAKGYRQKRRDMGHYRYPSLGSIFKNPSIEGIDERISAGKLIDEAGLLGHAVGAAKIAEYHGNIIINPKGEAKSDDIYQLIEYIQMQVKKKHDIALELEINLLGNW